MKKLRVAPRCSEMRHRPGGAPYNFATLSDSGEARAFWLYRNQGRRASIPNSTDRHVFFSLVVMIRMVYEKLT
ncbi:hypothetical protein HZH66_014372 [Vespula vulgaris]|uniref:Uncharacterized protein n=1 Tax=Vespula vulgaris TaxID=7454 RepID=A0A834J1K7_VESVU|nr:hypothetical protein HZH66_014372 [Vespula vulgaris]